MNIDKFHHYLKGPFATQYCSFTKKDRNSPWIAYHNEYHHNAIDSLIQATENQIEEHYKKWVLPDDSSLEPINLQIYYPLIICQGNIYTASMIERELVLKNVEHLQFRKEILIYGRYKAETYQIDIITENYLPNYLDIINNEVDKMVRFFKKNKIIVFESIKKVIDDAKSTKENDVLLRDIFEFSS